MRNMTPLQFILFAGCALVGLVALLAAGLAFGLALAGGAVIAVIVLLGWIMVSSFFGAPHDRSRERRSDEPL